MARPPVITYAPRAARWERGADGTLTLESPVPLGPYQRDLGATLREWAALAPDRAFLCERAATGVPSGRRGAGDAVGVVGAGGAGALPPAWRRLTYGEALRDARAVAQWLIDQGLGAEDAVLILTGASLEHAVLALGCLLAGVPCAPVSPALAQPAGLSKLRAMAQVLRPRVVFAQDGAQTQAALHALHDDHGATCVTACGDGVPFARLLGTPPSDAVEQRSAAIDGDTVVKYLFTSGSTGIPKAVPQTHRMLCANQRMMELIVAGDPETPPVFVDWLPWSHTFGGNVTMHWILREGGTLYIDAGKPAPGLFDTTLANLRDVSPTHFFNVPTGYALLADALERDERLAEKFFARLAYCFYGGASLPQQTWDRMQALARRHLGHEVMFTTGCGSTETGPIATFLHWPVQRAGIIGLPVPGVQVTLVPVPGDGRYEMRLRGPNIFDGYLRNPEATARAFDEEGRYRTGDAVRLVDPADPAQGLVFDGRVTEDFKLATGTFVQVGNVRVALVSAVRLVQEAVLAGIDRPWLGALVWLDPGACAALGAPPPRAGQPLDPRVRDALAAQLAAYNDTAGGSSQRVRRVRVLVQPPSAEHGEITEKGYVNQRAVLDRRAAEVERLYAADDGDDGDDGLMAEPADTSSLPAC